MVTRKPVAPVVVPAPLLQANPPYPTSPTSPTRLSGLTQPPDLHNSSAMEPSSLEDAQQRPRSDSTSSVDTWNSGNSEGEDGKDQMPAPLMVGRAKTSPDETFEGPLPDSLQVGPAQGTSRQSTQNGRPNLTLDLDPWAERKESTEGTSQSSLQSHNPYLRMQATGQGPLISESSASVWGDIPAAAQNVPLPSPVELPSEQTPIEQIAKLSLNGNAAPPLAQSPVQAQPAAFDRPISLPVFANTTGASAGSFGSNASNPWQNQPTPEEKWGGGGVILPPTSEQLTLSEGGPSTDLPLRRPVDEEIPPPKPPRPAPIAIPQWDEGQSARTEPETPLTQAKRQRSEHYQIKHINWYDAASRRKPRRSPILIQNANGPCPLLALVNALVLSTPPDLDTALVETLRTREQVSLGLLLDAVFDELMSGRRGDAAQELPDVGDLYAFLVTLHTGMNVNPRFVSPKMPTRSSLDANPADVANMHPAFRAQTRPGSFEETTEMRLYSTFDIPLIHGWIPPGDSSVYASLDRSAQTFEDAQNLMFREEELEDKVRAQGLTAEEQTVFEDIVSIKQFLTSWPTQLTDYGLDTIRRSVKPGQIAILFRNDHFSTLYKETRTGTLMTLVTDAGYSTHDEVVWESLVDVNGRGSELFSGDFRPVGNNTSAGLGQQRHSTSRTDGGPESGYGVEDGWETVQGRTRTRQNAPNSGAARTMMNPVQESGIVNSAAPSNSTTTVIPHDVAGTRSASEQEDHDLALALQLQEEEEDNQRREAETRRRNDDLSQRFLERENNDERPPIPPRRSVHSTQPRPANHADNVVPPPTYEQAASDRLYRPNATANTNLRQGTGSDALGVYNALNRQQSAYAQQSTATLNSATHRRRSSGGPGRVRRQQSMGGVASGSGGVGNAHPAQTPSQRIAVEEKCVVM
ncbi:hypothetical protein LTR66_008481 [Elasticomyces elasticus]|nr:hypothetical protein LTR66_008481 [Elasticomyces elasticus]